MNTGQFLISLDFELFWGVRDKRTIESYGGHIKGVRNVLPALLKLFSKYEIHATFATVGFLFCRTKKELLDFIPQTLPVYTVDRYSPYAAGYLDAVGNSEKEDVYHYASSLINMIQQHPEHEIGTHTFSHYYCLEGASIASFEADIIAAKKIAFTYGIDLKSIVFPRNQYSPQHIAVCKKLGIIAYRGNEHSAVYQPRKNEEQSLKIRAVRLLDAYLNITGHNTHDVRKGAEKEIVNLPSSAFLRPFSPKLKALDGLRIKRIKNSMTYAAKRGHAYHLWWHPHNFGKNLPQNLAILEEALKHYKLLNRKYNFKSSTMKELAAQIVTTDGA